MAQDLNTEELEALLVEGGATLAKESFAVLRALCNRASASDEDPATTELVLRAMEQRECFGTASDVLDALLRHQGLFPYLEDAPRLSIQDAIAVEFHRPPNLDDIVFHRVQARIYDELVRGQSVVLSAPTSFGKSLLIDAVIASGIYKNIVIIVPTLALVDETRKRLTDRFGRAWKIITHRSQHRRESNNIYILTAERIAEYSQLPNIDFFVIDEFYKLSPNRADERCTTLNQALYKLLKKNTPFYLLGPNIEGIPEELKRTRNCTFHHTDYKTVASEVIPVDPGADELGALVALAKKLEEPTLIYCRSPQRVRDVAKALADGGVGTAVPHAVHQVTAWLAQHFHPAWTVIRALEAGIGVHHGRVPRWLGQHVVRLFNDEAVRFLVCSSTLIEGVNTKAKNVVVFDKTISKKNFDQFTFNNIRGRAGRMGQHYVGRVYLFHDAPDDELPFVDVPAVTLDESAPDALLLQADLDELTPGARRKVEKYYRQRDLDVAVLRENADVDPADQLKLAAVLHANPKAYWQRLHWRQFPSYEELETLCTLMWTYLVKRPAGGIRSASQLTLKVRRLQGTTDIASLIRDEEANTGFVHSPDEAVDNVLDFLRYWVSYNFAKYAMAVDRIQRSVFPRHGLPAGDYSLYAGQVQHLFSDPGCVALEEYGVPFQLAKRFESQIAGGGDLDVTLDKFKNLRVPFADPFERGLIEEAQRHL